MQVKYIDLLENKELGDKKLAEVFNIKEIRFDLIKRVIFWQRNKARSGNHKVKTISEISGTTAKPFKQKGTGNARQGSKRSAHMRGGSTAFGPVVRDHSTKLQKKVRRLGLISSISYHIQNKTLEIIKEPKLEKAVTKEVARIFNKKQKTLVIYSSETDDNFLLSSKNVKDVNLLHSDGANVYDIMNNERVLVTEKALELIEKRLAI